MSVFDQRGQKVNHQTNVAGDLRQRQGGDTVTVSGNLCGSILNIKSTLSNVAQTINARPADPSLKAELNKLIEQLSAELAQTPPDKEEEAEAVAQTAQALIETAAAEKPNKTMLRITGEGLKKAAENIAGVMPVVLVLAGKIVAAAFKLGGA